MVLARTWSVTSSLSVFAARDLMRTCSETLAEEWQDEEPTTCRLHFPFWSGICGAPFHVFISNYKIRPSYHTVRSYFTFMAIYHPDAVDEVLLVSGL